MENWIIWFGVAGLLVVLEIFTGTFYLLMIALGIAAGGVAALAGLAFSLQFVIAAVVGVVATDLLRRSRLGKIHDSDASRDSNVNLDIGQKLEILHWNESAGRTMARVMYRGAMWDVELDQGATAQAGTYVIREMRGSCLIVMNDFNNESTRSKHD